MRTQHSGLLRILKWLDDNLEAFFMVTFLGLASVFIFVQVVARYVFESSFSWSEEVSRYMFIWLIYLGISYAVKTDSHIKVDALLTRDFLSDVQKKLLCILSDLIFLAFSTTVAYVGYQVAHLIARRGQITAATEIPMWIIYLAVPVGYSLCTFRLLQTLVHRFRHFHSDFKVFYRQVPSGDQCPEDK
ncbi:TRAP transporter small permease [Desulfobaculum bizertense]|uniref:TRAP-type C4-dicarboxylate transport system, small permease component n=1 Tax=Desulfobaculum bizertense DSM 18034 TaxID=1121442 RepID=A0A1T4VQC6_9BACT|nr:TRAP transporter small permease [Desulfobaculum bizertense]UIJ38272.1 TRAP transporter small permease [Desulfobaculum bizertense]SKA67075.1 TRAP-type C4-dicarboxylate transport system, small permease component [Desulfobaculum bizertense DSM 18034]